MLFVTQWIEENKTKTFFLNCCFCLRKGLWGLSHLNVGVSLHRSLNSLWKNASWCTRQYQAKPMMARTAYYALPEEMPYLNYFYLFRTWRNLDNGRVDINTDLGAKGRVSLGLKSDGTNYTRRIDVQVIKRPFFHQRILGTKWPNNGRYLSGRVNSLSLGPHSLVYSWLLPSGLGASNSRRPQFSTYVKNKKTHYPAWD